MIVIVCGPPAAGKTTLTNRVHKRLATAGADFKVVRSDEFSRRTYEQMYEQVAESGTDWLLDGTFYEQEWRERFRELGDVRVVYVDASLETCLERNREREQSIDEQGVYVIYSEFEEPDADLTIDTDDYGIEAVVEEITRRIERWRSSQSA